MKHEIKIVVLDGGTLNPGDLNWNELKNIGDCEVYDTTPPDKVVERSKDAEILIINKIVMSEEVVSQLPNLKYIGVIATGYNVVDIEATSKRGITVTNVPTYGTQSVAQLVFALLLELCHRVGHHSSTVHDGKWCKSKDFCYWDFPLVELADLTMGIVGFGRIGRATGNLSEAFGMNVIAYDVFVDQMKDVKVKFVELEELFKQSDVISLHCPLTAENEGMINSERLGKMKKTALLINTSRGPLVNEKDLASALNTGQIAGAGLDVLSSEPPKIDNPLLNTKNCFITPHIAWATRSARKRLMGVSVENVKAFLGGEPTNVIS